MAGGRPARRRRLRQRSAAGQRGRIRSGRHGHDVRGQHARPWPYGGQVNRCVDYLLACAQPSGFIAGPTPAAGRCMATASPPCSWPSATAWRPGPSCATNWPRRSNSSLIARTRRAAGATTRPGRGDVSVTVCQIMALRAARQRRPLRAAPNRRSGHRLRQAKPKRRRRIHVHDPRRRERLSPFRRRRDGPL